jgi:formylglycine-generating enzyme required for sulfatase activity
MASIAAAQQPVATNTIGMEFVLVPAGSITMGKFAPQCAETGTQGNVTQEQHDECVKLAKAATRQGFKAVVARPFYVGKYEVTQEQWQKVMGTNPSYHTEKVLGAPSGRHPVDSITWADAQAFVKKLNAVEKTSAYRLPTEVEWEYAASAGTEDDLQGGKAADVAWFMNNADYVTHPVGLKQANKWGIYDMLGNVWEWVQDHYDYDVVPKGPKGPSRGTQHVLKGGGFQAHSKNVRVSVHAGGPGSIICTGLRVVKDVK